MYDTKHAWLSTKQTKPSGGSALLYSVAVHAWFSLLGGMTLSLELGLVRPSSSIGYLGSI